GRNVKRSTGADGLMQWDIGKPNPRQIEFFKARARFIAYGGARGGGKSWAVRKKAAGLALSYPGAGILIVRRTFPELRENHILPMTADLAGVARYRTRTDPSFPGGSRIVFGYCSSESDVLQYQGQEYDVIFMDEATQFTEFQFTTLTACLRGANDFPKRFYLTCNPGGVGHAWVKRLFIDRRYKKTEHPEDYVFIAANVYDNHALMAHDPDYVRMLENLPEEQCRAWLLGQWDIFEGQYFAEFDRNVHVCRPYGIPAHWRRYVTLDYGMDMLAALWVVWTAGAPLCTGSCTRTGQRKRENGQDISSARRRAVRWR
ncbi:MAG: phage terminase large subunit, partial [Ruthenibacterium lactatiformans]